MRFTERYTLVINGEEKEVVAKPNGDSYNVLYEGVSVAILSTVRLGKFVCEHLTSGSRFYGRTRRHAVTSMIYSMFK